jgi:hypothetical protein
MISKEGECVSMCVCVGWCCCGIASNKKMKMKKMEGRNYRDIFKNKM